LCNKYQAPQIFAFAGLCFLRYNSSYFGEIMKTVELTLQFVVPDDSNPEQWVVEGIYQVLSKDEMLTGYWSVEKPGDQRD